MTHSGKNKRILPALHALRSGDADGLRTALDADPEVVNLTVGDSTMLELTTQPGAAPRSPEIVDVFVEAGAALDRALNLAGCWNLADLCLQLLAAGADPTARADAGITPLESAAMHSSTEAADVLVGHGLHRRTLWLAAATGLLPMVRNWVATDGSLLADPGPYRPDWADVGRPAVRQPTTRPRSWARPSCSPRPTIAGMSSTTSWTPARMSTPIRTGIQPRCISPSSSGGPGMVRHLLDRGACVTIEDGNYRSDAMGWANACEDGSEKATEIRRLVNAARSSLP